MCSHVRLQHSWQCRECVPVYHRTGRQQHINRIKPIDQALGRARDTRICSLGAGDTGAYTPPRVVQINYNQIMQICKYAGFCTSILSVPGLLGPQQLFSTSTDHDTVEVYLRLSSKLNDKLPAVTVLSARCQNQMRKPLIDAKIVCAPQVHVHNFINYLAVFFNTSHSNNVDILHIQNMNSKIFVTKNSFMDLLFNSVAGVLCRCGIVPNVGIYYLPSSSWEPGDLRIIIFSALKTFQLLIYNGEIIKHGRMA